MIPWGRKPATDSTPANSPAGATFGPWADHDQRCKCNVCR